MSSLRNTSAGIAYIIPGSRDWCVVPTNQVATLIAITLPSKSTTALPLCLRGTEFRQSEGRVEPGVGGCLVRKVCGTGGDVETVFTPGVLVQLALMEKQRLARDVVHDIPLDVVALAAFVEVEAVVGRALRARAALDVMNQIAAQNRSWLQPQGIDGRSITNKTCLGRMANSGARRKDSRELRVPIVK
ncbi:MAG TPA: hypothetical protein VND64_04005 [Pirellulales bacterium]|nr:hypothetical protein [Pirellulales bacterium]